MTRDDRIREAIDLLAETRHTFRSRQIQRAREVLEEAIAMDDKKTCPACGEQMSHGVHVGAYELCRACAGADTIRTALEIAKHRHAAKLRQILAQLDAQPD